MILLFLLNNNYNNCNNYTPKKFDFNIDVKFLTFKMYTEPTQNCVQLCVVLLIFNVIRLLLDQ